MNYSEKLEALMGFIYEQYVQSSVFQTYGEYAGVILRRFTESTGIEFGDIGAQLEAVRQLRNRGWVEVLLIGRSTLSAKVASQHKIKPTNEGILLIEKKRQPWVKRHGMDIFKAAIEGIIRGFKK